VTRVAAIDCGTNTIKLLVADVDRAAGTQQSLVRELRIVRLGQDVDRTGRLADAALARVFATTSRRSGSSRRPPAATRTTPTSSPTGSGRASTPGSRWSPATRRRS
jgi:hypothetical protein